MGTYEYNKDRYRSITVRFRADDQDVLDWIELQSSVNASIINLIRQNIEVIRNSCRVDRFEVMEDAGSVWHVIGTYLNLADAMQCLLDYSSTTGGKLHIVQHFRGILPDGNKIECGKLLNIKEKEEKENA